MLSTTWRIEFIMKDNIFRNYQFGNYQDSKVLLCYVLGIVTGRNENNKFYDIKSENILQFQNTSPYFNDITSSFENITCAEVMGFAGEAINNTFKDINQGSWSG